MRKPAFYEPALQILVLAVEQPCVFQFLRGNSMAEYVEVEHVNLSAEVKKKYIRFVLEANSAVLNWKFEKLGQKELVARILKGDKTLGYSLAMLTPKSEDGSIYGTLNEAQALEVINKFEADADRVRAIRFQRHEELGNRTIEESLLAQFAALCKRHARKWTRFDGGAGLTFADYLQEAYMVVIDSIYHYAREDVQLVTYVYTALRHQMSKITNKGNLFCPLTNEDVKLSSQFQKIKQESNRQITEDEIVEMMKLDERQKKRMIFLASKVYTESQFAQGNSNVNHGGDDESPENDYTSFRAGLKKEGTLFEDISVKELIERAKLSDFERVVFETSLNPYYGWQSDVARNRINPVTKKPFSRMRVTQILADATAKVGRVLKQVA